MRATSSNNGSHRADSCSMRLLIAAPKCSEACRECRLTRPASPWNSPLRQNEVLNHSMLFPLHEARLRNTKSRQELLERHIKRSVSAGAPGRQAKDNDSPRVLPNRATSFSQRLFLLSPNCLHCLDCLDCLVLPAAIGRGRLPFAFISSAFYVIITAAQWSP